MVRNCTKLPSLSGESIPDGHLLRSFRKARRTHHHRTWRSSCHHRRGLARWWLKGTSLVVPAENAQSAELPACAAVALTQNPQHNPKSHARCKLETPSRLFQGLPCGHFLNATSSTMRTPNHRQAQGISPPSPPLRVPTENSNPNLNMGPAGPQDISFE